MSSLLEALARARISVEPDFLVLVEKEIHIRDGVRYVSLDSWNDACARAQEELFARVRPDIPKLTDWINARFHATVYEDPYSPFCLIAGSNGDADAIHAHVEEYCRSIPNLAVVRNDVYARFSHVAYNKGTALAELAQRMGVTAAEVFAAGDHLNDLPMLSREFAHWLAAPQNAVAQVKLAVQKGDGIVSELSHGNGVAEALSIHLKNAAV